MEEKPREEIMIDPRWSILQDGLGYNVLLVGGISYTNTDGEEVVEFTIKPDEIVRKRYNLRYGYELNDMGNMKFIAKKIDLIPLNMYDDANRKWLYVRSLKHEETELSQREKSLKLKIESKDRRILLLEGENIRLSEQLNLAKTSPAKFIQQSSEVFKESAKALAEITNRDKQN